MRRGERGTGNRFSTHVLELHRPAREFVFLQHTCSIVTVPGSAGEPAPASQSQRHHLQRDPVPLQLTRALGGRPAHRHNRWQKDPPLSASWTRYAGRRNETTELGSPERVVQQRMLARRWLPLGSPR